VFINFFHFVFASVNHSFESQYFEAEPTRRYSSARHESGNVSVQLWGIREFEGHASPVVRSGNDAMAYTD
jgi:hypothetical protein